MSMPYLTFFTLLSFDNTGVHFLYHCSLKTLIFNIAKWSLGLHFSNQIVQQHHTADVLLQNHPSALVKSKKK